MTEVSIGAEQDGGRVLCRPIESSILNLLRSGSGGGDVV